MPHTSEKLTAAAKTTTLLCILDGWGDRSDSADNAIQLANTPNYDHFVADYPHSHLQTSGLAVGLPDGQMGNSEVGHMNLGGGRVILQNYPRIDQAIDDGSLYDIETLQNSITTLQGSGGACHLLGLLSPGGVHSHQDQIVALAKAYDQAGIQVYIHAFTDGRDVPPQSALEHVEKFLKDIEPLSHVSIATLSGRYYAMDRDKRWDRVVQAYESITHAQGERADDALSAIQTSYDQDIVDEFIKPVVIGDYTGMKDGDGLCMTNFRADRAREILEAYVDPDFNGFDRPKPIQFSTKLGLVPYSNHLDQFMGLLFPAQEVNDTLGQVVSQHGKTQLRIAETEKYAHITFFFNGGSEDVYEGEDRTLIPSPDVPTYDLKPEMSAHQVTDKLVDAINSRQYDLIVVNYANPDMVGHTGVLGAAIKAVETIDHCIGRLEEAILAQEGHMLLTADHGNIELMKDQTTQQPHTAHTTNLVPFILVGSQGQNIQMTDGALCDVAPTILSLMDIEKPKAMGGHSLLTPQ